MAGDVEQAATERSVFPQPLSRLVPPLTMALPVTIFAVAALGFPLALARLFAVPSREMATWIAVLYGAPAVLSVLFPRSCPRCWSGSPPPPSPAS